MNTNDDPQSTNQSIATKIAIAKICTVFKLTKFESH